MGITGELVGDALSKVFQEVAPIARRMAGPREADLAALQTSAALPELKDRVGEVFSRAVKPFKDMVPGWNSQSADAAIGLMDNVDNVQAELARPHLQRLMAIQQSFQRNNSHIFDVMEGKALPMNQAAQDVTNVLKGIYSSFGTMAQDAELPVVDTLKREALYYRNLRRGMGPREARAAASKASKKAFEPMENYMPHYFTPQMIMRYKVDGTLRNETLAKLAERFPGLGKSEYNDILDSLLTGPEDVRNGVLQHMRVMDLEGYDTDWYSVTRRYIMQSSRRLAEAQVFGKNDEVMKRLAQGTWVETGDKKKAQMLMSVYRATVGRGDRRYAALVRPLTAVHAMTMLSTSALMQPIQLLNMIPLMGTRNTFEALSKTLMDMPRTPFWKGAPEAKLGTEAGTSALSGVAFNSIIDDFGPVTDVGQIPAMWSRLIGLEYMDNVNRLVAATGGRIASEQWGRALVGNVSRASRKIAEERLTSAGLDVGAIAARGGQLTEEEVRQAGRWVARYTQFGNRPMDMPELRTSPLGPLVYLFRTYSIQQAEFLWREGEFAIRQPEQWKHMAAWLGMSALTAPLVSDVIDEIKKRQGDEAKVGPYRAVLRQTLQAGGAGAFWDVTRAAARGPDALMQWTAGPTATELTTLLGSDIPQAIGVTKLEQGNVYEPNLTPMLSHGTRRIPIFGPMLHYYWFGQGKKQ